jgi:alpha-N-arabinofuranosidase
MDDRDGKEQRPDRHRFLPSAAREREPRRHAVGFESDRARRSPQLWIASYYVQCAFAEYLGTEVPASSVSGGGERFFYSVTRDPAKAAVYLKLVNASSIAQPVQIAITGASSVGKTGTLVSLTGNTPEQTNTISAPKRIVPVTTPLKRAGAEFSHTVPPYSVQVLELQAK